jgi:hypothetical protein
LSFTKRLRRKVLKEWVLLRLEETGHVVSQR